MKKAKWTLTGKPLPDFERVKATGKLYKLLSRSPALRPHMNLDHDSVWFSERKDRHYDTFSVILSPTDGGLLPDGWVDDDGGEEHCGPAPWKAKVIDGIIDALDLDEESLARLRFARRVFAEEIVHPSIVAEFR